MKCQKNMRIRRESVSGGLELPQLNTYRGQARKKEEKKRGRKRSPLPFPGLRREQKFRYERGRERRGTFLQTFTFLFSKHN